MHANLGQGIRAQDQGHMADSHPTLILPSTCNSRLQRASDRIRDRSSSVESNPIGINLNPPWPVLRCCFVMPSSSYSSSSLSSPRLNHPTSCLRLHYCQRAAYSLGGNAHGKGGDRSAARARAKATVIQSASSLSEFPYLPGPFCRLAYSHVPCTVLTDGNSFICE